MQREERHGAPGVGAPDGVQFVDECLLVASLVARHEGEVARGRFDGGADEGVGIREAPERDHASGGHPADGESVGVDDLRQIALGHLAEDVVHLPHRLLDDVERVLGLLHGAVEALAVAGEVDGDGGDAGADPAEIAAGIEFLVDRSPVHPEDGGGLGLPVGVGDEGGDALDAGDARLAGEGGGELGEAVRGGLEGRGHDWRVGGAPAGLGDLAPRVVSIRGRRRGSFRANEGVALFLAADGGCGAVAGEDGGVVREGVEAVADGLKERRAVA